MGCSVVFHKNNVFDYWLLAPSPEPFSLSFVLRKVFTFLCSLSNEDVGPLQL